MIAGQHNFQHLRGKSVLYDNSDYGNYNIDDTNLENTPVLSQTIPAEKSLENSGVLLSLLLKIHGLITVH